VISRSSIQWSALALPSERNAQLHARLPAVPRQGHVLEHVAAIIGHGDCPRRRHPQGGITRRGVAPCATCVSTLRRFRPALDIDGRRFSERERDAVVQVSKQRLNPVPKPSSAAPPGDCGRLAARLKLMPSATVLPVGSATGPRNTCQPHQHLEGDVIALDRQLETRRVEGAKLAIGRHGGFHHSVCHCGVAMERRAGGQAVEGRAIDDGSGGGTPKLCTSIPVAQPGTVTGPAFSFTN